MRIVILGTGNLATRLGMALHAGNSEIVQVFGRTASECSRLADILDCTYTTSKTDIIGDADLYLLAVSENAIPEILTDSRLKNQLVVHTSGSISMDILSEFSSNYGVFYPLQTLSRQRAVDFTEVPICIEANNPEALEKLSNLAKTISNQVYSIDSKQRVQLHLSAVFVCNFVNHLYTIGEKLLQEQQLDFNLLRPLITETAQKVLQFSPHEVQTGPAIRRNLPIMDLHLKMLAQHPEWLKIYELISSNIQNSHNS